MILLSIALLPAAALPGTMASPTMGKGVTAEDFEKESTGPVLLADVAEDEAANDACPGQVLACGDRVVGARIEAGGDLDNYAVSVEAGTCLTVGTLVDSMENPMDTVVEIRGGDCSGILAMDDDNGPGSFSLISSFRVPATGTYVVRVRSFNQAAGGAYRLFVVCDAAGAPNTICETATPLPCGAIDLAGTTACTGNDYNPLGTSASCTNFSANGQDVVFSVNAVQGNTISLTYTSTADGSIYIVRNGCASPPDSCEVGADATRAGDAEHLTYAFEGTGTYFVILDSFGNVTSGSWTLTGTLDCETPVEATTWGHIKARHRSRESLR